jgi:demethylmenaquinone methyltransferase/2-methoxy-6-polyprenyl-1,4-benzoquinol methylase
VAGALVRHLQKPLFYGAFLLAFYLLGAATIIRSSFNRESSCFLQLQDCSRDLDALKRNCHSNIAKMFDQISTTYDRTNRFLSLGLDLRWRRALSDHLPEGKSLQLLDLATGTGDQIASLIQKSASIESAIGIDLSDQMLNIAKNKLNASFVQFQKANVEAIPFEDETFDLCTFSFGIRNIESPLRALSEMFRVTKRDGRCLILEFSLPRNRWRWFYLIYLRHLIPCIGALLTKNRAAYRHLNQSIEKFAPPEKFLSWMEQTGWSNVKAINVFFGIVTLYRGDKK